MNPHPTPATAAWSPYDHPALADKFRPIFQRIADTVLERERTRTLPHEPITWLKQAGFGAVRVPVEHGGGGASIPQLFQLLIELSEADSNVTQALRGHFAFVEDRLNAPPSARLKRGCTATTQRPSARPISTPRSNPPRARSSCPSWCCAPVPTCSTRWGHLPPAPASRWTGTGVTPAPWHRTTPSSTSRASWATGASTAPSRPTSGKSATAQAAPSKPLIQLQGNTMSTATLDRPRVNSTAPFAARPRPASTFAARTAARSPTAATRASEPTRTRTRAPARGSRLKSLRTISASRRRATREQ